MRGTDEQLRADVAVAQPGRRQPHHLKFLRGQLVMTGLLGGDDALACRPQLGTGTLGPRSGADHLEHPQRRAQWFAGSRSVA